MGVQSDDRVTSPYAVTSAFVLASSAWEEIAEGFRKLSRWVDGNFPAGSDGWTLCIVIKTPAAPPRKEEPLVLEIRTLFHFGYGHGSIRYADVA